MGACYSVVLKVKFKPNGEERAVKALQEKIIRENGNKVNYSLEKYSQQGVTATNFENLMRIFLGGWNNSSFETEIDSGYLVYYNAFDASYGWESVMYEMFEEIKPFIENGSEFKCDI